LTKEGAKRFAEVTHAHVGKHLAIMVDGKLFSAPNVMSEITGGIGVITGSFSEQEATELAARLNAGVTK
jgi:preprotein translocase subunit SecD